MRLCIVPMKPLADAKQRLAPVLTPAGRRALSLGMLEDVVSAALALDVVWVLNSDDDAAAVASRLGAEPRPDPAPGAGLNASLSAATADAIAQGASGVLVVSADLPAVTAADVDDLASFPGVAIATDHADEGTNALWRSPPDVIEVAFGPESRRAHEGFARAAGAPVTVLRSDRLLLDVDTPEDLDAALVIGGAATRTALKELGYPATRRR